MLPVDVGSRSILEIYTHIQKYYIVYCKLKRTCITLQYCTFTYILDYL